VKGEPVVAELAREAGIFAARRWETEHAARLISAEGLGRSTFLYALAAP
jgi:hypothetical protein